MYNGVWWVAKLGQLLCACLRMFTGGGITLLPSLELPPCDSRLPLLPSLLSIIFRGGYVPMRPPSGDKEV